MTAPSPAIRIKLPQHAGVNEPFTVRALIGHAMESGLRRGDDGAMVPRHIIRRFTCSFAGVPAFACDLEPGMAANPYLEFSLRLSRSATLVFAWEDDNGVVFIDTRRVEIG